uniref:Uncharacterized protein LOC111107613 n=1 Tax=Crassostrea virginica TaxID=6565 RepID=A0A8B8B622_CRAVI|nr:uncharacterized protein LOC111107613 [Crassostrea virginica]
MNMEVVYTVQILRDYKNDNRNQYYRRPTTIREISTASNGAACGASFRIGEEYTITGSISGNQKWSTHLCRWVPSYEQLNAFDSGFYKNTCACDVRACYDGQCPQPASNRCIIPQGSDISCFLNQSTCRPGYYGCTWHSPACF